MKRLHWKLRKTLRKGLYVGSCLEKITFTVLRQTLGRGIHVGSCLEKITVLRHSLLEEDYMLVHVKKRLHLPF